MYRPRPLMFRRSGVLWDVGLADLLAFVDSRAGRRLGFQRWINHVVFPLSITPNGGRTLQPKQRRDDLCPFACMSIGLSCTILKRTYTFHGFRCSNEYSLVYLIFRLCDRSIVILQDKFVFFYLWIYAATRMKPALTYRLLILIIN